MAQTDRQTDTQTDGHGDSMTDPAQRAESVKIIKCSLEYFKKLLPLKFGWPLGAYQGAPYQMF